MIAFFQSGRGYYARLRYLDRARFKLEFWHMHHKLILPLLLAAMVLFGTGLSSAYAQVSSPGAPAQTASTASAGPDSAYILGTGDKVRINVFGQQDLNGEYEIDGAGTVQLPLVGQMKAAGLTVQEFQKEVVAAFANGYLVNPNIGITVTNYRPYYIMGEVNKPGPYSYVSGMNIITAIALAGGYTPRADKSEVYVRRNGSTKEVELPSDETTRVNPGDIVRVAERFF